MHMQRKWAPLCLGMAVNLAGVPTVRAASDAGVPNSGGAALAPRPTASASAAGNPRVPATAIPTPKSTPTILPTLGAPKAEIDDKAVSKAKPRAKPPLKTGKAGPTRPSGPARAANEATRRSATGDASDGEVRGVESPELAALREADAELFRPASPAVGVPWPGDLPPNITLDPGRPLLRTSGLPPARLLDPPASESGRDLGWLKGLSLPELPVRWDARVVRYLDYYRSDLRGKNLMQAWLRKSGRYGAAMRRGLQEQGLPDDLIWVSLVESGFDPTVRSSAGAAGLWQLMPVGARAYGLVVDRWIDERLDLERSTQAAARYLSDLHRRFGAWELALAAYNMGYGGLLSAIRKYNTNDYWELASLEAGIPYETALYVPKIIALAVASKNNATFALEAVKIDPPVLFESTPVPSGISIKTIAAAAGVETSIIEGLNPQLRAGRTPPDAPSAESTSWMVRVPPGKRAAVAQALPERSAPEKKLDRYSTKLGDSADSIALSRGTSKSRVLELNALRQDELLRPGTVLLVPPAEATRPQASVARSDDKPIVVTPTNMQPPSGKKRIFYRVVGGDALPEIAGAFRVTQDDLRHWNALDPSARLHEGMTLQVFVEPSTDLSKIVYLVEADVRCLTVGSDEFFAYFEGLRNRKRTTVVVRDGDSWEKIAKRFNLTVGQLERINQRSRTDKLVQKETLVIYAPVGRSVLHQVDPAPSAGPSPLGPIVPPNPDDLPGLPEASSATSPSAATRAESTDSPP